MAERLMNKQYRLFGLLIVPVVCLCCWHNDQENFKKILAAWTSIEKKDPLPITTPSNQTNNEVSVTTPQEQQSIVKKLPKAHDNKKKSKARMEEIVFKRLYKLNLRNIFEAVCIAASVGQDYDQCENFLRDCRSSLANECVIKSTLKIHKNQIKKIVKATKLSLEMALKAFDILDEGIKALSILTCEDDPIDVATAREALEKNFIRQYGDDLPAINTLLEVLFEYALNLGFFGK